MFNIEKHAQELQFRLQNKEKELDSQRNELITAQRKHEKGLELLMQTNDSKLQLAKEEYAAKVEKLQQAFDEEKAQFDSML